MFILALAIAGIVLSASAHVFPSAPRRRAAGAICLSGIWQFITVRAAVQRANSQRINHVFFQPSYRWQGLVLFAPTHQ